MGEHPDGGGQDQGGTATEDRSDGGGTGMAGVLVTVLSIAFTLFVVAFVSWHIVADPAPQEDPAATVVGTRTLPNGQVAVTVELNNPYDSGLAEVTVESPCSTPPAEVSFSMVPAESTATGTLVCPSGTTDPEVSVAAWVIE